MKLNQHRGRALRWRAVELMATSAVCLVLSGCGNDLAQVSGVVTLDGEPLRGGNGVRATVYFQPASGVGTVAVGILDEDGQYYLSTGSEEGIEPGEYIVTFSAAELVPSRDPSGTPTGRRITHPKYANAKTSGFRFTVEPGKNEFNLSVESPPRNSSRRRG